MKPYPKIHTILKRDPDNNYKTLIPEAFSKPEFRYLRNNDWIWREKIHGTNIRVIYHPSSGSYEIKGRKEKSQVPSFVMEAIWETIHPHDMSMLFGDKQACLYGEGFGRKIQNVGSRYIPDGHSFILFDVMVDGWWLQEDDVTDVATDLGIDRVPILGVSDLDDAMLFAERGFSSRVSEKPLDAEGLVMVPEVPLTNRKGERIITKIKSKDFRANQRNSW